MRDKKKENISRARDGAGLVGVSSVEGRNGKVNFI
jgi:hypothetical protein